MATEFISNKCLYGPVWGEPDRWRWPESYDASFESVGDRGFFVEEDSQTSWYGRQGTTYRFNAFLPADNWGDGASGRFAKWRCSVFLPDFIIREKPIVLIYSNLGRAYDQYAWLMPAVLREAGCICVFYETPMSGTRVLSRDYAPLEEESSALAHYTGHEFNEGSYLDITRQVAYNARQVVEFVARRYGLPHRKFATAGFSLGGHLALQTALANPCCLGASVGCSSFCMRDYYPQVPRLFKALPNILPDFLKSTVLFLVDNCVGASISSILEILTRFLPLPAGLKELADHVNRLTALLQIDRNAFGLDMATPGQKYVMCFGNSDWVCTMGNEVIDWWRNELGCHGASLDTWRFDAGHSPFHNVNDVRSQGGCVAAGMLDGLHKICGC